MLKLLEQEASHPPHTQYHSYMTTSCFSNCTSSISLIPRPPFNTGGGSGNETKVPYDLLYQPTTNYIHCWTALNLISGLFYISGLCACTTWSDPLPPLPRTASHGKLGGAWKRGYCDGRELVKQKNKTKKNIFLQRKLAQITHWWWWWHHVPKFHRKKKNFPQNLEIHESFLPRKLPTELLTQAHLTKPYTEITIYKKPINYNSPGKQYAKVFSAKISFFFFVSPILSHRGSLVPRPHLVFHHLQYRKAGEGLVRLYKQQSRK